MFPTWTCLIDGVSSSPEPFRIPINRWPMCEDDTLPDGQQQYHSTNRGPDGQQFWFDYMQYKPSENVPLDNANIYVDSTDPDITYGTGWSNYSSGQEATTSGTSLKLNFSWYALRENYDVYFSRSYDSSGTSVIWVGIIPTIQRRKQAP